MQPRTVAGNLPTGVTTPVDVVCPDGSRRICRWRSHQRRRLGHEQCHDGGHARAYPHEPVRGPRVRVHLPARGLRPRARRLPVIARIVREHDYADFLNQEACDCSTTMLSTATPSAIPAVCGQCTAATCSRAGTDYNLQYYAKAYPTIREIELVHLMGPQGILSSICPIHTTKRGRRSGLRLPAGRQLHHQPAQDCAYDRVLAGEALSHNRRNRAVPHPRDASPA
jgi:hypothetical protein